MRKQASLPQETRWELLATATLGRLALSAKALPSVIPVQYYLDHEDRTIALCVGEFPMPDRSIHDVVVALSVDEIDRESWFGWTVEVIGRLTREVHEDGGRRNCGGSPRGQVLRLDPKILNGYEEHMCQSWPCGPSGWKES